MAKTITAANIPENKVLADPTKAFFVTMLTRDIQLIDAIMDLIDNCIDGVNRQNKLNNTKSKTHIYKGYYANITISEKEFLLQDNCGGIPVKVAKEYAFKMGRSDDYHDDDNLETLGMYGIGLKRAIFKMGLEADVFTWNKDDRFKVSIPADWTTQIAWTFDYTKLNKSNLTGILKERGTAISVRKIHPNISTQFKDVSGFIKNLSIALREHYGYIIQQGFKIRVNGTIIDPIIINILTSTRSGTKGKIDPYVYSATINDVQIEIAIGFYRPLATEEELKIGIEGGYAPAQSENAGVTVICNDRVVLYCDKTFLTGWGEAPVPKYHTQFISIAGVIHFRSNKPFNLPVTTTKRGLDTSSAVYNNSKTRIKEGLRIFTSFTNDWKTPTEERAALFKATQKINALAPGFATSANVSLKSTKKDDLGKYQIPNLPKPPNEAASKYTTISFSKEKLKIERLKEYYFEGEKKSAAEVGSWCFDRMYSKVEK